MMTTCNPNALTDEQFAALKAEEAKAVVHLPEPPTVAPLTPHEALTVNALYTGIFKIANELTAMSKHYCTGEEGMTRKLLIPDVHKAAGMAEALLTVAKSLRAAGR
jgi:hypothetical protein